MALVVPQFSPRSISELISAGSPIILVDNAFPDDVAFSVALDGGEPVAVSQAVSPDRDYLWLDPVFEEAVKLSPGSHTLLVSYAGRQSDREAVVDVFMLVPAVACKRLVNDLGSTLALCYDMQTAAVTWKEQ